MITNEKYEFLISLLDMDTWKFSFHYNIHRADEKSNNIKFQEILNDKINKRLAEIDILENGLIMLKNIKIVDDFIIENSTTDDFPF